jgi:hypothetical protein
MDGFPLQSPVAMHLIPIEGSDLAQRRENGKLLRL